MACQDFNLLLKLNLLGRANGIRDQWSNAPMRSSQQVVARRNTAFVEGYCSAWHTTSQIETSLLTPQHCNILKSTHSLKDFHFESEKFFDTVRGQAAKHAF